MEILETNKTPEKTFQDSIVNMQNRNTLNITGVEKVFETTPKNVSLRVAGVNMCVNGDGLNIAKLDVETGVIEILGLVNEIKYSAIAGKENIFKKLFKWYYSIVLHISMCFCFFYIWGLLAG